MFYYINPVSFKNHSIFFTDKILFYHKIAKNLISGGSDFDLRPLILGPNDTLGDLIS